MDLGTRIRKLRTRRRLTLQQLAEACGVTHSLLSKVETGRASPSVATLTRLAAALGTTLSLLLEDAKARTTAVTPVEQTGDDLWVTTDKGYRFLPLCNDRIDKLMQPLLFIAERGRIAPGPLQHGGEEFIHVLDGRMRYRVGRTTHELGPGDSLYFDAEEPHDLEPITPTVRYLAVLIDVPSPDVVTATPTKLTPRRTARAAGRRRTAKP